MEKGAREIIRKQEEKLKKEWGAKRDEKGTVKIGKKENGVKCRKKQGA